MSGIYVIGWFTLYYTEEQKTTEQRAREAKLLKDLLELIDERDKLERVKMSTQLE